MRYIVALFIVLMSASTITQAQEENIPAPDATAEVTRNVSQNCPATVQIVLDIRPRLNLDAFNSDNPDDIVELIDVNSLQLNAQDTESGHLENTAILVPVTANAALDIRRIPSDDVEAVASLAAGERIMANARSEDGDWLRVRFSADTDGLGWLPTNSITIDDNISNLPIVSAETNNVDLSVRYGPMQAFVFESTGQDASCAEAPNTGMLIQTPAGVASVTLWLDEVVIQFTNRNGETFPLHRISILEAKDFRDESNSSIQDSASDNN